jgi:hypothetical protein
MKHDFTQLTNEQRTYLQNILDAKIIADEHIQLLEIVMKQLKATLDHPEHPHGRQ